MTHKTKHRMFWNAVRKKEFSKGFYDRRNTCAHGLNFQYFLFKEAYKVKKDIFVEVSCHKLSAITHSLYSGQALKTYEMWNCSDTII